jgi:recombination protein RecA
MPNAALLRKQIEANLASRIPSALTPVARTIREVLTTGISEVDRVLNGGLPVGAISEIAGPECTGRTSLALSTLAQLTREGRTCAWVDANDSLDPESAAANGIQLSQLLWVRCGAKNSMLNLDSQIIPTSAYAHPNSSSQSNSGGVAGSHPRSEVRGLDRAIEELLHNPINDAKQQKVGTPCARNHSFSKVPRSEQAPTDRAQNRRKEFLMAHHEPLFPRSNQPLQAQSLEKSLASSNQLAASSRTFARTAQPWKQLDQALRATDLLLNAGGFAAIVLDLGSVAPEYATRVPLATWFRFRAVADNTRTSLLLLSQKPCAGSSAAALLSLASSSIQGNTVVEFIEYKLEVEKERFQSSLINIAGNRKPPASTWAERMPWAGRR